MLIANSISITIKNLNDINILNTFQASELLTRQNIVANPSLLIIAPNGDNIFNLMSILTTIAVKIIIDKNIFIKFDLSPIKKLIISKLMIMDNNIGDLTFL